MSLFGMGDALLKLKDNEIRALLVQHGMNIAGWANTPDVATKQKIIETIDRMRIIAEQLEM